MYRCGWYHHQYFCNFCDYVCRDIETNNIPGTDSHWIFIWDNLTAHHSQYVHKKLTGGVGPQPLHHPKYCPIEYKIYKVIKKIWLKKEEQWDVNWLDQEILIVTNRIKTFDSTIVRCAYVELEYYVMELGSHVMVL